MKDPHQERDPMAVIQCNVIHIECLERASRSSQPKDDAIGCDFVEPRVASFVVRKRM